MLLVGLDERERAALDTVELDASWVDAEQLGAALVDPEGARTPSVVVVGGSRPASASTLVQQAHRLAPEAVVAVLVGEDTEAEVRQHVRYAAGVPTDLELVRWDVGTLRDRLSELADTAARRQAHDLTLAGIGARESARQPAPALVRASLGTLLEHAPLGVVVADLEHRVLAHNRCAAQLLALGRDVAGEPLSGLFPDRSVVDRLVGAASTVDASDRWPEETTQGPGERHLDVSAAMTQLDDGRDVVMILLGDASARLTAEQARDVLSDRVAMIGRVSEALLGTQDPDRALGMIAGEVVPTLADWVSIQLYDDRGPARRVVTRHGDPAMAAMSDLAEGELPREVSDASPSRRIAAGEPAVHLERVTEDMLRTLVPDDGARRLLIDLGVHSAIAVPLDGRRTRVGSMVLVNGAASPPLKEQELQIAIEVGRRVGTALETLQLYRRQRALAEELQRSMLTEPQAPDHAEIEVRYLPASHEAQVGGDWYDAYLQPDGGIVLTIGDVVGHDFRAAAAMGQLRGLLRGIGYARDREPGEMLRSLDAAIQGLLPGITATAVVARIAAPGDGWDTADGSPLVLHWSNAGHPPPILVPRAGAPVVLTTDTTDVLLGVVPGFPRTEVQTEIHAGDTLVLYSDGLIERRGRDLDEGLTQLLDAIVEGRQLPPADLCDHLLRRLVQDEHDDDVALVVLRLRD